jgi:hypothetical protein
MLIARNQIIQIFEGPLERVLYVDINYEYCITINVEIGVKANPEKQLITELEELWEQGNLVLNLDDPFRNLLYMYEITANEEEIRDSRWDSIKEFVDLEPEIYLSNTNKMIREVHGDLKVSKRAIYQNLRLYWQKGSMKNALLPEYRNCGGRGKRKNLGDKKTGRPTKDSKLKGINVTDEIERIFAEGASEFKENKVTNQRDIYVDILDKFFADDDDENPSLPTEKPSLRQFRYWYENHSGYSEKDKKIDRIGKRQYNSNFRPVLSRSDLRYRAPGARWEIDSTTGDVYLVSEMNPDLNIGKPTIYFIRDVYSRMIVGMYVGLENASWEAAKMAIINAVSNKEEYCKSFGVDIKESDWPVHHLPKTILSDNGELKGYKPKTLLDTYGVKFDTTPSFRGDLKGIIEQYFNMAFNKSKRHIPGSVTKDSHKRGEPDPRTLARITLKTYTAILINVVLLYNNHHWLRKYEPDEQQIREGVDHIPLRLWEWGVKRRAGQLKSVPEQEFKISLLPQYQGSITKYGIRLRENLFYECGEHPEWLEDAALNGARKIAIHYDPRNISIVYIRDTDGRFLECKLLPKSQQYAPYHIDDIAVIREDQKKKAAEYEHKELEKEIGTNRRIRSLVSNDVQKHKEETTYPKKSEMTRDIKENRANEMKMLQEQQYNLWNEEEEKEVLDDELIPDRDEGFDRDPSFNYLIEYQKEAFGNGKGD